MKKEGLDRHKVCMPALGRHFLLGDFYNYRTEHRVIAGKLFFFFQSQPHVQLLEIS